MKYPIGVQTFQKIIDSGSVYVDKTAHMHKLVNSGGCCFFLSRPRRFGKSLLISTLDAYFSGRRELFRGLAVDGLETEWNVHPVLRFDLSAEEYSCPRHLYTQLNTQLADYEEIYGKRDDEDTVASRFAGVIKRAYKQTGRQVVVLIDEYDKPLLMAIGQEELMESYRRTLKGFYGVLKRQDQNIRFALLTGVTRFSKVSVFSDLNNLCDISMDSEYADICGITEQELHHYFDGEIALLAQEHGMTVDEAYEKLRVWYDGYHFAPRSAGMYNPWSVLNALKKKELGTYWGATGTPTFLIEIVKRTKYDIRSLDNALATSDMLSSVDSMLTDPVPVIYQSGYLTIKGYDPRSDAYTLGFPNKEVERNWARWLVPVYFAQGKQATEFFVGDFLNDVEAGKPEAFMGRMEAFFADISYEMEGDKEVNFHNVFYILFKLMGTRVSVEYATSDGRIDAVVQTDDYVYVFELKRDATAAEAMAQIDTKEYMLPFSASGRRLWKIGVNFSTDTRRVDGYLLAECH